ncbi:MAG TPA: hypothetical protein VMS93_13470 [Candidatus Saccharimonadales bacterium]|nr:hypothetical protein [Candidatus Saccharimonadales bacterium]
MAERKPFLLRMDPAVLEAMQRWAAADLRSLNAQIEFVLRRALQAEGRLRLGAAPGGTAPGPGRSGPAGAGGPSEPPGPA